MAAATCITIIGLAFLIGSINADKHPNIVGGDNTVVKHFPFIVSIRLPDGEHNCGGSIISEWHILTAAHCVEGLPEDFLQSFTIHTGTSRTDKVGNVHKIQTVDIHPTFGLRRETDGSDDIAVITLTKPIAFNKNQRKVNLPSHDIKDYQAAHVVGWGRTSNSYWDSGSLQLQKLQVVLLSSKKCQHFLIDSKIDHTQVCSFRGYGKSACHGDSGGPLVSNGELVGVVSRGDTGSCADGHPDIYTNVFAYKDFIESVLNKKL